MTLTTVLDPATDVLAEPARASPEQVDAAVITAHQRLQDWRRTPSAERSRVLRSLADLVRAGPRAAGVVQHRQPDHRRGETTAVAATFDYYAGTTAKVYGYTIPGSARGTLLMFREPIGVCAAITPWSFPLLTLGWKVAPALAMGNTVAGKLGPISVSSREGSPIRIARAARTNRSTRPGGRGGRGARRVWGGDRLPGPGSFLTSAMFFDVQPGLRIARDEIFGPVATTMPFGFEEETVRAKGLHLRAPGVDPDPGRWPRPPGDRGVETGMLSINSSSSVHIEGLPSAG